MLSEGQSTERLLFMSAVIELWDRGMDTLQIAKIIREPQEAIERALHEALDLRRKEHNEKS